jgi:predicted metalloprotease with PDZ domain
MRKSVIGLAASAVLMAGGAMAQGPVPGMATQDPGPNAAVSYDISFANARHHEAQVVATWRGVPKGPLTVQMSRSSPGRYAIHEFAKNVYNVSAVDGAGRPLKISRTDPYSWIVSGHDGVVKLTYTLYGDRGDGTYSQVDATHAHLNMPATFMWAHGYDAKAIRVKFNPLDPKWTIATQLPQTAEPNTYWARNFQYFMDSPTEIANLTWREWPVTDNGRTYTFRLALHDPGTAADADVFAEKLKKLVPQHIRVFGAAPQFDYGTYTFIADYMPQISGDGMEHRNSTFISQPRSLLQANFAQLGTASHEFVHAWNVKRIRPAEIDPFDFTQADPTPSLWLAEGFTQYYGPLLVRRSGQMGEDEFLASVAGNLNTVLNRPGRLYGSPQEMSLRAAFNDAATAIDPMNTNINTSYYPYGAVVALALDLTLRGQPKGLTLDDFMKQLWKVHGAPYRPYRPADLPAALGVITGDPAFADGFFKASVEGNSFPDFEPLLAQAGLKLRAKSPKRGWLGATRVAASGPEVTLAEPPAPNTPFYGAGIEKGDRILALGRLTIASDADWQGALGRVEAGEKTTVRFVQRGQTIEAPITALSDPTFEVVRYEAIGMTPTAAQLAFREKWMGVDGK